MPASDLRSALRSLRRSPLFVVVSVLSLGIALALNTTMFALVDAVMRPPMPYAHPERLFIVTLRGDDPHRVVPSDTKVAAIRERLTVVEATATVRWSGMDVVAGSDGDDRGVAIVSPDFFHVLGVAPHAGRLFGPADAEQRVAVISLRLWRAAFQERALSSGLTVELDGTTYGVVGVAPPGLRGTDEVWIPESRAARDGTVAGQRGFTLVRLKPGATREQLKGELEAIGRQLQRLYGSPDYPLGPAIGEFQATRRRLDDFFRYLSAVMLGVLAIACANLATLLLARGAARRREMAVRLAIGASRWAVARHVLLECTLLGLGGAVLGALLTRWATDLVAHWAPPHVPQLGEFVPTPSWRIFAFGLGVTVLVLALAGLLPAVQAARVAPAEPLKDGAGTTRRRRERYNVLVVAEVALSTGLLMLAVLLLLDNWRLARYEFGFNPRRLVVASIQLPTYGPYKVPADSAALRQARALERLQGMPGIQDIATVRLQGPDGPVVLGENGAAGERWINLRDYRIVSPSYLRTMGLPVLQGRDFSAGDQGGDVGVAIVDQEAARRLWPEFASPVGRMLKLGSETSSAPWVRVIGVTPSLGRRPDVGVATPDDPRIYVIPSGAPTGASTAILAMDGRSPERRLEVRRAIRQAIGEHGAINVYPYAAGFDEHVRMQGFLAWLFCVLSAFALTLCAVGLYGVLAYAVSQRSREFAIRIALGARGRTVAQLVVRDAAVMALAGVGLGAFLALWATYGMAADYAGIRFAHAKALVAAEVVLLLVALGAAWAPVRRGQQANPAHTLQAS